MKQVQQLAAHCNNVEYQWIAAANTSRSMCCLGLEKLVNLWIGLARGDLSRASQGLTDAKPHQDLFRSCDTNSALITKTKERNDQINAYLTLSIAQMRERLLSIAEVAAAHISPPIQDCA